MAVFEITNNEFGVYLYGISAGIACLISFCITIIHCYKVYIQFTTVHEIETTQTTKASNQSTNNNNNNKISKRLSNFTKNKQQTSKQHTQQSQKTDTKNTSTYNNHHHRQSNKRNKKNDKPSHLPNITIPENSNTLVTQQQQRTQPRNSPRLQLPGTPKIEENEEYGSGFYFYFYFIFFCIFRECVPNFNGFENMSVHTLTLCNLKIRNCFFFVCFFILGQPCKPTHTHTHAYHATQQKKTMKKTQIVWFDRH